MAMESKKDLRKLIAKYLKDATVMQLATSVNNRPWACTVNFAADKDLNLYWMSSINRRHSKEILRNRRVAGAIVVSKAPHHKPQGIQFEGTAEVLTKKADIARCMLIFAGKVLPKQAILAFMRSREQPHRFYRVRPTSYVLFDTVNFPGNARQELDLREENLN